MGGCQLVVGITFGRIRYWPLSTNRAVIGQNWPKLAAIDSKGLM